MVPVWYSRLSFFGYEPSTMIYKPNNLRIFAKVQKTILVLNFASFIASRISFRSKRTFSKMIVRIAIIGIMLGLGVMILSVAIVKGFQNEVREKIRGFSGDIQVSKLD